MNSEERPAAGAGPLAGGLLTYSVPRTGQREMCNFFAKLTPKTVSATP
jgi:hypothetical protein